MVPVVILYRPVGPVELKLIEELSDIRRGELLAYWATQRQVHALTDKAQVYELLQQRFAGVASA
jgi:hypothetical protein